MAGNADFLTSAVIDPFGNHTTTTLGDMPNQVVQTTHDDAATGRITEQFLDKESSGAHVDDVVNLVNPAGGITAVKDVQGGGAITDLQCFSYDRLGRLTEAWTRTAGASGRPPGTARGHSSAEAYPSKDSCRTATSPTRVATSTPSRVGVARSRAAMPGARATGVRSIR
jgi:hypothetical protein